MTMEGDRTLFLPKKELIKELNNKILFNSRKIFGMYSNIQWCVEDIKDSIITIRISSSDIDFGILREDGSRRLTKDQVANNIKDNVYRYVDNVIVKAYWTEWKSEHGGGFLISTAGKTKEQIVEEVMRKVNKYE